MLKKSLLAFLPFLAPMAFAASASNAASTVYYQALDGESCSDIHDPSSCSHNYYARNGYTLVTRNPSHPSVNWDDPNFFNITVNYALYVGDLAAFETVVPQQQGARFVNNTTGAAQPFLQAHGILAEAYAMKTGPKDPPFVSDELVSLDLGETGDPATVIAAYPNSTNKGRIWDIILGPNTTVVGNGGNPGRGGGTAILNQIYPDADGAPIRIGNVSYDGPYWFAGDTDRDSIHAASTLFRANSVGLPPLSPSRPSPAQMDCGCQYGGLVDLLRSMSNGSNQKTGKRLLYYAEPSSGAPAHQPISIFVETYKGQLSGTPRAIRPAELNWAVWSTLIHGAREVQYFGNIGTNKSSGGMPTKGVTDPYTGRITNIRAQVAATNALIVSLAPVLNGPFAVNFASVTPNGYTLPIWSHTGVGTDIHVNKGWMTDGVEIATHYYAEGTRTRRDLTLRNGYYIFSDTSHTEADADIAATYTYKDDGVHSVPVVYSTWGLAGPIRSTCSGGSCTFTVTFPHASDVAIFGPL